MSGSDHTWEARVARRRAQYSGELVSLGTPKPRLYDALGTVERLQTLCELSMQQWLMSHPPPHDLPRAEWPGEIFRVFSIFEDERKTSTRAISPPIDHLR